MSEDPRLSETDSIHRRRLRQHRTASTSTDRSKSSSRAFQRCLARPVAPTCWCTAASRSLECHPRRAPTSDPIHFQASQRVASAADFEPTPSALMTSIALHAVTMLSCLQVITSPPTSTASLQGPYVRRKLPQVSPFARRTPPTHGPCSLCVCAAPRAPGATLELLQRRL